MQSMVKDKIVQFRVLCIGSATDIRQIMIIGKNQVFLECVNADLISALIDIISAYYVFDISYPDGMVVVLSFLQEIVLKCSKDTYRDTKYSALMTELKSKMLAWLNFLKPITLKLYCTVL